MSNETPTDNITEVRKHLFAALRGLTDTDKPMDIDRARAVSDVAQTIINSAKVENDHLKLIGGTGTGFIPDATPTTPGAPGLPAGTQRHGNVMTHRLKG